MQQNGGVLKEKTQNFAQKSDIFWRNKIIFFIQS